MPDFYALDRFGGHPSPDARLDGLLDNLVPLRDANHADVDRYVVEIPTRYCRCMARLEDGRTVELVNPRAFVGWACADDEQSFLFHSDDVFIELCRKGDGAGRELAPGREGLAVQVLTDDTVEMIDAPNGAIRGRKYTGIDGGLFVLS